MRIILPFVCLILYSQSLISQNLNVAGHDGVDASGEMISINSKSYYLGASRRDCNFSNTFLACLNDSGRTIAKHSFGTYALTYFGRLISTFDKALVFTGKSAASTDIGPYDEYVIKMDTNGLVLFQTSISGADLYPKILSITQHNDSSYYLVSHANIIHLSKNGQLLPQTNPGLTQISAIKALTNGNLLLNANVNSMRHHLMLTPTGSILTQQVCLSKIVKYIECPNYILALTTNGTIEKLSVGLTVQATSSVVLNSENTKITDFAVRNDSIFVAGTSTLSEQPFYAILDSSFNLAYQTAAIYKGIRPTGISITNKNTIHIISTSVSKSSSDYSFISMYRFGLTGTFHSTSDVGVIGFSNFNTQLLGGSSSSTWMIPYIETNVTVKNFGADTVKNFYLNYYGYTSGISYCYFLLHKKVEIPLAPGALMTVPTGSFYGLPFYKGTGVTERKLNICIFTTAPNTSNDVEIDNDAYCDTVLFTLTGITKNSLLEQSIQVYPNPSSSGFMIDSDVEIKTFELVNALGEIIRKEAINAKEYYLNDTDLKSGIYFVKLETEKGTVQKKIIKN